MGIIKFWSISHFDSGSGAWISDRQIPRAGLEQFNRTETSTLSFLKLVDGSKAKLSSEVKSNWETITLVFPKQVVNETVKNQFLGYLHNEQGVKIAIPLTSGASAYTEKVVEGYITKYTEDWILDSKSEQHFVVKLEIEEFDVDGA